MKLYPGKLFLSLLAGVFGAGALLAQVGTPVPNWTVPPYHHAAASGGLGTMADVTPGVGFVGIDPCRLVDTRQAGFPATYGTPALVAGVPRNFDLNSQPNCPGIPAGVEAYSLNFTVTNVQGPGFLKVFPQGGSVPADISTLNYIPGQNIANAAIVPTGTNGGITVISGVSGTDLIIDINGYFTDEYNPNVPFVVTGIFGQAAVMGINTAAVGAGVSGQGGAFGFGVVGQIASDNSDTAGVFGDTGFVNPDPGFFAAGVRGEGRTGVLGVSGNFLGGGDGVAGALVDGTGAQITYGALGTSFGTDPGSGAPPWGVFSGTTIGAVGTKHFLDPHPTDPKLVISYISLEGPEAGTYFRGRAKFQNGMARISVPEHFRFVTDPEGLTVQITPIGAMASFAVMKMDLNEIVVQASRNVEFSYLVQGVRATYKDTVPVQRTDVFMPRSAGSKMPLGLSPAQKRLLIQNGTYREDGTVNMETARRLGWDKFWEQRPRPAPQPAEP
jgi:hypothetical protein